MAKKIKLSATLPDGTIATRTTARTYTHVIAVRPSWEAAIRRANADNTPARHASNWGFYQARLNGEKLYSDTPEKARAEAIEKLGGHETLEAFAAAKLQEALARVEAAKAAGEYDSWGALTWCGRLSLAQNELAKARKGDWWAQSEIAPVNA